MPETERHELYELARREVSDRFAELMIKAVPAEPDRLATKDDLAVLGSDLRAEMADLRTELKTEMADLRTELKTEMADLRTELKSEMADLRTDLTTEMADVRLSLTNEIHESFEAQTRVLLIGLIVSVVLIALTNTLTVLVG